MLLRYLKGHFLSGQLQIVFLLQKSHKKKGKSSLLACKVHHKNEKKKKLRLNTYKTNLAQIFGSSA